MTYKITPYSYRRGWKDFRREKRIEKIKEKIIIAMAIIILLTILILVDTMTLGILQTLSK